MRVSILALKHNQPTATNPTDRYGVDLVLNGHVHAYERTHPMYKYKPDTCGPIYITIGDGGNVEGPYR